MADDENKLMAVKAQLAILQMRANSIEYDYEENLDQLIADMSKGIKKLKKKMMIKRLFLS